MIEIAEGAEIVMAQPGPQRLLLSCPADEIFTGGARGGGKSFGLVLMALNRSARWGRHYAGLMCRPTYDELDELISQCAEVFTQFGAIWRESKKTWKMPGGGTLKMRYLENDKDARRLQGRQFTDIMIDEAGNYPDTTPLDIPKACLRNVHGVPSKYVLAGNWGGPGHEHLKRRYYDPAPPLTLIKEKSKLTGLTQSRAFIPSKLDDNPKIAKADPGYIDRIYRATIGKPWLRKAWIEGLPDAGAGGKRFALLWNSARHCGPGFRVPWNWPVDRSFDWGYSSPYSVGHWTVSDGAPVLLSNGTEKTFPRGTLIRIGEIYGADRSDPEKVNVGLRQSPKDICDRIKDYEAYLLQNTLSGQRIAPGPADTSIWDTDRGASTASKMAAEGIHWTRANKAPGTRLLGWRTFDELLKAEPDQPGFYVFDECRDFARTVVSAPCDPKNPEDVDTHSEDHALDDARYRVLNLPVKPQQRGRKPIRVAA